MPTPSIQTLVTDAQQILNLDSISAVRSVVAVALANANTGTPLNPNLTTQQLWNEFYQVVNKPKSDIESIIANQLMKFLFAPPAPGGVGANGQVIFNDGGVLAGDAGFTYDKATDSLTVLGRLGIGITPSFKGHFYSASGSNELRLETGGIGAGTTNRLSFKNASGAADARTGAIEWYDVNTFRGDIRLLKAGGIQIRNSADSPTFNLDDSGRIGSGASPDANFRFTAIGAFASGLGGAYIETGEFNRYGLVVNNSNGGATTNIVEIRKAGIAKAAFTAAGNLAFDNALGVDFSATPNPAGMTSELLNDYEEGTWVGTVRGLTSDPTTPVTATGRYTRVGRSVTVQIGFENVDTTGAAGGVFISGLPFANTSVCRAMGSCGVFQGVTFTETLACVIGVSGLNVEFMSIKSNTGWSAATHFAGTDRYFWANLTYTV